MRLRTVGKSRLAVLIGGTLLLVAGFAGPAQVGAAAPTVPVPTKERLALILTTFDSFNRSGMIDKPQVASSLRQKLTHASDALAAGSPSQAQGVLQSFVDEITGQSHNHVNPSAANTLVSLANGAPPPTQFTVTPSATTPTVVATAITTSTATGTTTTAPTTVTIPPANNTISTVTVAPPPPATVLPPPPPNGTALTSMVITAATSSGAAVTMLTAPAPLSATFSAPPPINPYSAVFTTFDSTGAPQILPTTIVANADGTFTATASTPHFSTFVVNAGRPTVTSVTPVYGPIAGGTGVQIGGFSLQSPTRVLFGGVDGTNVSYANNTLTAVSPAGPVGPATIQVVAGGQFSDPVNAPQFTYYAPLQATAVFAPSTVYTGDAVTFNAFSSGGYGAVTFAWTFSDNLTAAGATVTRTYAQVGTFTASVTATDSIGNKSNTVTLTINVIVPFISGKVTDSATHAALAGVTVEVDSFVAVPGDGVAHLNAVTTALTAADGTYSASVPNGTYKVHFLQTADHAAQWLGNNARPGPSPSQSVNGAPITGLDAALVPGFQVTGTVTHTAGAAPGVTVTAYTGGSCCTPVTAVTSDASGAYAITLPNGGSYVLDANPPPGDLEQLFNGTPGGTQDFNSATVITAARTADFALVAGHIIDGTVSFANKGVEFVNVTAIVAGGGQSYGAQTDGTGLYRVTVPTGPAQYVLRFNPLNDGSTGSPAPIYLGGGTNPVNATQVGHPSTNNITLPAGFRIYGNVAPAQAGFQINILDPGQPGKGAFGPLAATFTDGSGNYSALVPAGTFIAVFNPNQRGNFLSQWYLGQSNPGSANQVAVTNADVQLSQVTLQGGYTITGTVDGTSGHLSGIFVNAATPPPAGGCCPQFVSGAQTDNNGYFTLLVPAGTFIVQLNGPQSQQYLNKWFGGGADPHLAQQVHVDATTPTFSIGTVTLQKGIPITGFVTDAVTKNGIGGVNIGANLPNPDGTCCDKSGFSGGTQSQPPDGHYTLLVPAGKYYVFFNAPSPYLQAQAFVDASSGAPPPLNEALSTGFVISGHVLDANNNAVTSGNINVNTQGCCFGVGTGIDNTGFYSIAVPAGTYIVSYNPGPGSTFTQLWYNGASSPDQATPVPVGPDQHNIDFHLTTGFTLTGQVTDHNKVGLGGVSVNVFNDRGATAGQCCGKGGGVGSQVAQTQTDANGFYSVVVPANGGYVLQFDNAPPGNLPQQVLATADVPTKTVNVQLLQGVEVPGTVTGPNGAVAGVNVGAMPAGNQTCCFGRNAQTDGSGKYILTLEPNTGWIIQFTPGPLNPSQLAPAFYNGTQFGSGGPSGATVVNTAAVPVGGANVQLQIGAVITGQVVGADNTSAGLPNVGVELDDPAMIDQCCQQQVNFTQTDGKGNYTLIAPPTGSWLVQANSCCQSNKYLYQFYNGTFDPHAATPVSGTTANVNFTLPLAVILSGTVTANGAGIGGVGVNASLLKSDGTCCIFNTNFGGMTGPDGVYSIAVPNQTLQINVNPPPGWVPTYRVVSPPFGPVNFALSSGTVISGTASDSNITSGPNGVAQVNVSIAPANGGCCVGQNAVTDGNGYYTMTVPDGDWIIQFQPSNGTLAPQWYDGTVTGATTPLKAKGIHAAASGPSIPPVNASLVTGTAISGHVDGVSSLNLRNIGISIVDPASIDQCCWPSVTATRTDLNGDYSVVVPAGSWLVNFQPDSTVPFIQQWYDTSGNIFDRHQATPISGPKTGVSATLPQGYLVSGRVTIKNSNPVVGIARVNIGATLTSLPGNACCQNGTQTAADGSYSFYLPSGTSSLGFNPPAGYIGDSRTVTVGTGPVTGADIALVAGSIVSGQVVDAGGLPVSQAHVQAYDSTQIGPGTNNCCARSDVFTDPNGNFQLTLPNGSWDILIQAPAASGMAPQWYTGLPGGATAAAGAKPIVVSGPDIALGQVKLAAGTVISGQVTNTAGTVKVANVFVTATDTSQACCYPATAFASTDSNGNYSFTVADSATYNINFYPQVQPAGYLPASVNGVSVDATGNGKTVNAQLADGVEISGTVTSSNGGVGGVNISAYNARPAACCSGVGGARSNPDGSFAFMVPANTPIEIQFDGTAVGKTNQWYNGTGLDFTTATIVTGPLQGITQGV